LPAVEIPGISGKWQTSAAVIAGFLRSKSAPSCAEIPNQEFICRERASLDSERRIFWLAKAEEWEQRGLDEVAFPFRERNLGRADFQTGTHSWHTGERALSLR
jgi:hypothetical protein